MQDELKNLKQLGMDSSSDDDESSDNGEDQHTPKLLSEMGQKSKTLGEGGRHHPEVVAEDASQGS